MCVFERASALWLMLNCMPVNDKNNKKVLRTVHILVLLIYISFVFFGFVLRFSQGKVVTKKVFKLLRNMDEIEAMTQNTQL